MVYGIIADPQVLEEEHIPENIPCREVQKQELAFCLSPIERGMKPLDCLCHGKPGTGKTVLVKYVLQQAEENSVFRKTACAKTRIEKIECGCLFWWILRTI